MPIPASHIVEINPRVITGGSADLAINGLLLSKNALIPASRMVLQFADAASVGEYFGTTSTEYAAARVYFGGYTNQQATPQALYIGLCVDTDIAATLIGSALQLSLNTLQAIRNGAFNITINGTATEVTGLDFSASTSLSECAEVLEAKLAGTTCAYSTQTRSFIITTTATGASASLSIATPPASGTDCSTLLGLSSATGAVASAGSDALEVDVNMTAILAVTQNWVTFTTSWEAESPEILEWAEWANANWGWLYVAYTTNASTPSQTSTSDPASALLDVGYDNTAIVYGALAYAMFIMGAAAAISWTRLNSTITFAFKSQSGLAPTVTTQAEATALEAKQCNYYGQLATRNAEFEWLYPGCLVKSDYGFIDALINAIWLNNRLQVSIMDGLGVTPRAPYTRRGYTLIRAWMMTAISAALVNASIEPGVQLSETQRGTVMNEAGKDISEELFTQGYFIQILDPGSGVRAQRGSPVVNLWYTYGGAVQRIEVSSTAIL